jgi:hypothetical protein
VSIVSNLVGSGNWWVVERHLIVLRDLVEELARYRPRLSPEVSR